MKIKNTLILCISALLLGTPVAHATPQKDYENLLKKPAFYQNTTARVRNLKQLAAGMITTMHSYISHGGEKPFALSPRQAEGLTNLYNFARTIEDKLRGRTSPDMTSAGIYATLKISKDVSAPVYGSYVTFEKQFFADFNQFYTPIIDAITITNKKRTNLPRAISFDTLSQWIYRTNSFEPDL